MISFKKYTDIVGDIAKKLKVSKDKAIAALVKAQEKGINPLKWQSNIAMLTTFASIVAEYDPTVDERVMTDKQKLIQIQHYWDDLDHMASDDTKKKSLQRLGYKNIKLDSRGKITSFDEGFLSGIKNKIKELKKALSTETKETKEMGRIYKKMLKGKASKSDVKKANEQFKDLLKAVGLSALAAVPIPGGGLLLGVLIKLAKSKFGINLMPSAFYEEGVGEERDYKDEYKKFQSSEKMRKYRAELNKYNRDKGTYGNGDGKDASHKDGKIVGMEDQSTNRGRAEKSRLVGSKRK